MGQAAAAEAGALPHALNAVQRTWMEAEAYQPRILRTDRHTAWRTDGGAAGTATGFKESYRHLLATLRTVGVGGQGD